MALALVFSFLIGVSQVFGAGVDSNNAPIIGKSKSSIVFRGSVLSRDFQIWNAGVGTLKYTLDINGTDANNFTIDDTNVGEDVNGQSVGKDDIKTHTVDVNYGQSLTTLTARIVITDNNDANNVAYINLTATPSGPNEPNGPGESHGPNTSLVIGRSSSRIGLAGSVISKRFQIWSKGKETLNYTLALGGGDAEYFVLNKEQGQSKGVDDKRAHTVSVNYDSDFHNKILYAWIEITDDNDNVSYIDLSATETIATRVSYISIEQGINSDDTNDFRLNIVTDSTVAEVNFTTAEGNEYLISDYNESGDGSIRYWTYPEGDDIDFADYGDGSIRYWTYPEGDDIDFADYGDGRYTIAVTYNDDDFADTNVNFGIPNKPGTIVWPVKMPVLTNPGDETVSPVRFTWDKCSDSNVGSIRVGYKRQDSTTWIEREYSKGTQRSAAINLETGGWDATLSFGRWYQGENDDGIEFEVGKCTRSQSTFDIMKWFGTDSDTNMINQPLKLTDCSGHIVTFALTGGGKGEVNDSTCRFENITLTDTTEKSVFSIATAGGVKTGIGNINVHGPIKAIIGRNVNLNGNIKIDDGAGSIVLNNVADCNITIGSTMPTIKSCALTFNQIDTLENGQRNADSEPAGD